MRTDADVDEVDHAEWIPKPIDQISDGAADREAKPRCHQSGLRSRRSVQPQKDEKNRCDRQNQQRSRKLTEVGSKIEPERSARIVDERESNERIDDGVRPGRGGEPVDGEFLRAAIADEQDEQQRPEYTGFWCHLTTGSHPERSEGSAFLAAIHICGRRW